MARHAERFRGEFLEALEPRALMDAGGPMSYVAYYPEGYSSNTISEYVPITNPNDTPERFELLARYEGGVRDQVLATGTIAARSRGGATLSQAGVPSSRIPRANEPYALVLRATGRLSATLSHYDFGASLGESFTEDTSTEWEFAEGVRDSDDSRDYVLVYNPSDSAVDVTLTAYTDDGSQYTSTKRIEGQRRGGWNINDDSTIRRSSDDSPLGEGRYSVRLQSTGGIVASQSRYEIRTGRGFGVLGVTSGGALAGFVGAMEFEDHGSGDASADSWISVLNTGTTTAIVTFHFITHEDDPIGGPTERTVLVAGGQRTSFNLRPMGYAAGDEFGVVYRSNTPVAVHASTYKGPDAMGTEAATVAATRWDFGEGYMSRSRAGVGVTEEIYIFNPTLTEIDVQIDFYFSTGARVTVFKSLNGLELEDVKVHQLIEVTQMAADMYYGVKITATAGIVASIEHWDDFHQGGFGGVGMPSGTVVDLSTVLAL